ncbi:MAG: hypothetical protein J1G02_06560 [Clostridiales bacterium]|nr:hypothetical protein [Clostridiales bacterium]
MKACKKTSILFASLAVLAMIALCLGITTTVAVAETNASSELALRKDIANNFIYSAEFTDLTESSNAGLVFGVSDDLASYWTVSVNVTKGKLELLKKDTVLKSGQCYAGVGEQIALTVVVNEGIAKVFVDGSNIAAITCKLDGYNGGKVGVKADCAVNGEQFASTDTLDGDIFCNGYNVLKVVNVNDGYRLDSSEYSVSKGVLTVSREYLKTLEADTAYTFRVVTSFTDFNFTLTTDFTSAAAVSVMSKYYRGSDVVFELSGGAVVDKLLIDGENVDFTQNGNRIVVSAQVVNALPSGKHSVKLYTNIGRPQTTFTLSEPIETLTELEPVATHTFFWIDFVIFGILILAYVAFTVIKKTDILNKIKKK